MLDKKVLRAILSGIAAFNLLLYLSMHTMLGFIGYAVSFAAMPYILGAILIAVLVISLLDTLGKHNKKITLTVLVLDTVFLAFTLFFFITTVESVRNYLLSAAKILALYAVIAAIIYLVLYFHKAKFYNKAVAGIVCAVLIISAAAALTPLKDLRVNYIVCPPAVYVSGNEYQIVWTTSSKGISWVDIAGEKYYDKSAGAMITTDKVHKVSVPQSALDNAKSYVINTKSVINEEAYSALRGKTVSKAYAFRPVDESDGVQYYTVSDSHNANAKAKSAGGYFGAKTDFVILAGDIVSYMDTETDLQRILKLAHDMTGGGKPVVFARGNHELKGVGAERLYRYVATGPNDNFYYTFRLGGVWGVVLDQGEDHADSWYEFFGTADYDSYRTQQIGFLDGIIADGASTYAAPDVTHRIAISHINTAFVSKSNFFMYDYFVEINTRLNHINPDIMISGHLHEVFLTEKGLGAGSALYYDASYSGKEKSEKYDLVSTGAQFDSVNVARRANAQILSEKEKTLGKTYIGTALEYAKDDRGDYSLVVRFTTHQKKAVVTVNPFSGKSYGAAIYLAK